jgi:ABC-type multidrug transport system fused ATPase/permease subunit
LEELKKVLNDKDKFFVHSGSREFKGLKEKIEFKNLNFSYDKKIPILKNINCIIEKGKMTAVIGYTGAGKTTIINLLLRFYEINPKSIFIDSTDIREFDIKSLREHIAVVTQEILLFNDTIKNNIIYGLKRKVNEKEMNKILKEARLHDFIISLPEGINAIIGDRGVKLSGGEKQRLAIARTLLKGSEILILDEATSSLDSKTEKLIQEAIDSAVKDRTSIVIAHRLSTIKNADKIIVIENGTVVEQGALKELIAKKGKFYEYWKEQKFD